MKNLKLLLITLLFTPALWAAETPTALVQKSMIYQDLSKHPTKTLDLKLHHRKGQNTFEYKLENAQLVTKSFDGYCQKALVILVSNKANVVGHKDYRIDGQEAFFIPKNHLFSQSQYIAEFLGFYEGRDYFVLAQYGTSVTPERECKLPSPYDNIIHLTGRIKGAEEWFQEIYLFEP